MVFPSLSEFSTVYWDPHSQRLWHSQQSRNRCFFLELSCFFDDPGDVGNLVPHSSAFSKTSLDIWSSQFMYCWSLVWWLLIISLLMCEMSAIVWEYAYSLGLPFLEIGMKTDLFLSCVQCCVFQLCWHIECSTFTAPSLRIWNCSIGIPRFAHSDVLQGSLDFTFQDVWF